MPANECNPFKSPGEALTFKATAAVIGKRFIAPSGNRTGGGAAGLSADLANVYQMAHCGAGAPGVGVSKYDTANGALGGCHVEGVVPVTAGAVIAAGQSVQSDANGQAIPWDGTLASRRLGVALTGAAAGADAEILLAVA